MKHTENNETKLILGIVGMPPESARNCVQSLMPIPNGEFRKTVNGELVFLKSGNMKKYRSVITCNDINSPIIDKIWIGAEINVGCIQTLWQSMEAGKTEVTLIRPPVANSVEVVDDDGNKIPFELAEKVVRLYESRDERAYVSFHPWLTMRVTNFKLETDEWAMSCGWRLELEEI